MAEGTTNDESDSHYRSSRSYVDPNANHPTPTWAHPLGPPPTSPAHSQSTTSHAATNPSRPHHANPGDPENPDKRSLPTGWFQQYEPRRVELSSCFCSAL